MVPLSEARDLPLHQETEGNFRSHIELVEQNAQIVSRKTRHPEQNVRHEPLRALVLLQLAPLGPSLFPFCPLFNDRVAIFRVRHVVAAAVAIS